MKRARQKFRASAAPYKRGIVKFVWRNALTSLRDPGLNFGDRLVHQLQRFFAMAVLVVFSAIERDTRFAQMGESLAHPGLINTDRLRKERRNI